MGNGQLHLRLSYPRGWPSDVTVAEKRRRSFCDSFDSHHDDHKNDDKASGPLTLPLQIYCMENE